MTATEDDFIPDTDGLVASNVAANVSLIHRLIEFVDDIAGDVSGTRRALAAQLEHHIAISIIKYDELGKVIKHLLRSNQAGPIRHYHLAFGEHHTD